MKVKISLIFLIVSAGLVLTQCSDNPAASKNNEPIKTNDLLVDSLATEKTVALFANLRSFTVNKILFGHQETTAYGVGWKNDGFGNRSDVKDVCGDFPAVYGWDIGNIGGTTNVDGVSFFEIKSLIKGAFLPEMMPGMRHQWFYRFCRAELRIQNIFSDWIWWPSSYST